MHWYVKCLKQHYCDFKGRARRKEYWMFTLANALVTVALVIAFSLISEKLVPFYNVYSLAILLPALGVTVRRLHDIGKSGWMILVGFVPLVGAFYLIYLLCQDSNGGANLYGPNPKT